LAASFTSSPGFGLIVLGFLRGVGKKSSGFVVFIVAGRSAALAIDAGGKAGFSFGGLPLFFFGISCPVCRAHAMAACFFSVGPPAFGGLPRFFFAEGSSVKGLVIRGLSTSSRALFKEPGFVGVNEAVPLVEILTLSLKDRKVSSQDLMSRPGKRDSKISFHFTSLILFSRCKLLLKFSVFSHSDLYVKNFLFSSDVRHGE